MVMRIQDLSPPAGSRRKRKRVGRGPGSGHGKTACRGHKGQRARSGSGMTPGFEGGQMPLKRRLPKRGFTNVFKKRYAVVNLKDLTRVDPKSVLDVETLRDAGLVKGSQDRVKLLGTGEVSEPIQVRIHRISGSAKAKIEAVGGKVEIVGPLPQR